MITNRESVESVLDQLGPCDFTVRTLTQTVNDVNGNNITEAQVGNVLQNLAKKNKVYRTYETEDGYMVWVNYVPRHKALRPPKKSPHKTNAPSKITHNDMIAHIKQLEKVSENAVKVKALVNKAIEALQTIEKLI